MKKRILCSLMMVVMGSLFACHKRDGAPKVPGSKEELVPHDGIYVSEYGSLTFNGDGESIELDIGEELAAVSGMNAGYAAGTYYFLIDSPRALYDYDRARIFLIHIDGEVYEFIMPVGATDENRIVLIADGLGEDGTVAFEREQK